MSNSPAFSVIIPVYNRAEMIRRAIDSVLNQTNPPAEIIVVDDGSTDDTSQVLKSYRPEIQIIQTENRGVAAARNTGIARAQSEWITLLDSDDQWLPDKLRRAVKFIEENPELRIFQSEEIWIRNGRRVNPKNKHRKPAGWIFESSLKLCLVSPSAVVFQKSLFEETGGFDESMTVCEDYDLWLRMARNEQFGLDPLPGIYKYGGHDDQLSAKFHSMDLFRLRAMEKHLHDPSLPEEQRRAVRSEMIYKLEIYLNGAARHGGRNEAWKEKLNYLNELKENLG